MRRVLTAVMVAVLAISVGVMIYLFASKTESTDRSALDRVGLMFSGDDDASAVRNTVIANAQQFILEVNTYGPADLDETNKMPGYRQRVGEVISPKFKASFDEGVTAAEASVAQAGVGRSAEIFGSGVAALDADTARVLVAGSFTVSYPDTSSSEEGARVGTEPSVFRVEVALVKVDGTWLVDDFVPLTGGNTEELPGPEDVAPNAPVPSESAPSEPAPSEPVPSEPAPSEPAPSEPAPTQEGGQ